MTLGTRIVFARFDGEDAQETRQVARVLEFPGTIRDHGLMLRVRRRCRDETIVEAGHPVFHLGIADVLVEPFRVEGVDR